MVFAALSVVPVRRDAADSSEMISQLLFGEHYQVLEKSDDAKWCRHSECLR